jgi:hypothetical protein
MRSKKNESIRKRKYGNKRSKRSNKSKKCGCGVKLPFLKWGGDSPNGQGQSSTKTDLTQKLNGLLKNIQNASDATTAKLSGDFDDLKNQTATAFNNAKDSTNSVFNDTKNQIKTNTDAVLNTTKSNTKDVTKTTSDFFGNMVKIVKKSLHDVTKPTVTNKDGDGSFPSKPDSQNKSSIPTSTSSLSNSNSNSNGSNTTKSIGSSNSSNNNNLKYMNNTLLSRYKKSLQQSTPTPTKGGKRRSSKKSKSRSKKYRTSKKTKRRHIYKHKGGSGCMDGPVGIEKSSLAFTASPISNIKAVGPTADQMYGQTPYPSWRFSG